MHWAIRARAGVTAESRGREERGGCPADGREAGREGGRGTGGREEGSGTGGRKVAGKGAGSRVPKWLFGAACQAGSEGAQVLCLGPDVVVLAQGSSRKRLIHLLFNDPGIYSRFTSQPDPHGPSLANSWTSKKKQQEKKTHQELEEEAASVRGTSEALTARHEASAKMAAVLGFRRSAYHLSRTYATGTQSKLMTIKLRDNTIKNYTCRQKYVLFGSFVRFVRMREKTLVATLSPEECIYIELFPHVTYVAAVNGAPMSPSL